MNSFFKNKWAFGVVILALLSLVTRQYFLKRMVSYTSFMDKAKSQSLRKVVIGSHFIWGVEKDTMRKIICTRNSIKDAVIYNVFESSKTNFATAAITEAQIGYGLVGLGYLRLIYFLYGLIVDMKSD